MYAFQQSQFDPKSLSQTWDSASIAANNLLNEICIYCDGSTDESGEVSRRHAYFRNWAAWKGKKGVK